MEAVGRFQRVSECVAQIEERADTGFALILRDDARLGAAGDRDRLGKGVLIEIDDAFSIKFEPVEEFGVVDEGVFYDPAASRAVSCLRAPARVGRSCRSDSCLATR